MTEEITEPLVGFRRWGVTRAGTLYSIGVGHHWPESRLTARCIGHDHAITAIFPDGSIRSVTDLMAMVYEHDPRIKISYASTCVSGNDLPFDHPSPSFKSLCGIYAHKLPIPMCVCRYPQFFNHGAIGAVRMWGRVIEHTDGYRAEHTEIAGLVDLSGGYLDRARYSATMYPTLDDLYSEWLPDWGGKEYAKGHEKFFCSGLTKPYVEAGLFTIKVLSQDLLTTENGASERQNMPADHRTGVVQWLDKKTNCLIEVRAAPGKTFIAPDGTELVVPPPAPRDEFIPVDDFFDAF